MFIDLSATLIVFQLDCHLRLLLPPKDIVPISARDDKISKPVAAILDRSYVPTLFQIVGERECHQLLGDFLIDEDPLHAAHREIEESQNRKSLAIILDGDFKRSVCENIQQCP